MNIRKLTIALGLLLVAAITKAQSSDIRGYWYSQDSTRIYKVTNDNGKYQAVLFSTTRKNEQPGACVLKDIAYNEKHNRYEGLILAVKEPLATNAKIFISGKIMTLHLQHFFITHDTIKWIRAEVVTEAEEQASH